MRISDWSSDVCSSDLSRVNIIIPPLAIDGPSISIRKFSKKGITLDVMARQNNISQAMATVLKIAARSRLNILISGGTDRKSDVEGKSVSYVSLSVAAVSLKQHKQYRHNNNIQQ